MLCLYLPSPKKQIFTPLLAKEAPKKCCMWRRAACGFLILFGLSVFWGGGTFAAAVDEQIVLRDALQPGSAEAAEGQYKTVAWTEKEKAFVLKSFRKIHAHAPGLVPRAAADGKLSMYRAPLRNYAKGGTRYIVLDKKAFLYPVYSYRVLLHELVHSADTYKRLSGSKAFQKIYVPKIKRARSLLKQHGLTPATAAALPLGAQRKKIERMIREQTRLPSAYAARNLAECLAEVVSFWLLPEYRYTLPAEAIELLSPFVQQAVPPVPNDIAYRSGQAMYRKGDTAGAIREWAKVLESDPGFYQARWARGYAYLRLNQPERALRDLQQVRDTISPYESGYQFYDKEWKRIRQQVRR